MLSASESVAAPSPAAQLREAFEKWLRGKIRVTPCHSARASSLGLSCERQLFYEQSAWEQRALPPIELQAIFELGKDVEEIAIRRLEGMGVQILQRGKDYIDRRLNLTGHVDAKLGWPGWTKAIPAEIKGLNPFTAGSIRTVEDIRDHKQEWVRKYYGQLQTYLYLDGSELGVFVLFNKVSGQLEFIDCPLDYAYAETLLQKAERVRDAVKMGVPPPRHLTSECAHCPFVHVCQPDMQFGPGVELLDSAELEAMLKRREELSAAASEWESLDKSIKAQLPKRPELIVGEFALTGKEVSRKGFTVEPSKFWKWEIARLLKEKPDGA